MMICLTTDYTDDHGFYLLIPADEGQEITFSVPSDGKGKEICEAVCDPFRRDA